MNQKAVANQSVNEGHTNGLCPSTDLYKREIVAKHFHHPNLDGRISTGYAARDSAFRCGMYV